MTAKLHLFDIQRKTYKWISNSPYSSPSLLMAIKQIKWVIMKHELVLRNLLKKCFTLNIKQTDYIYAKLFHMYHYSFIPPQKGKRWTHKEE